MNLFTGCVYHNVTRRQNLYLVLYCKEKVPKWSDLLKLLKLWNSFQHLWIFPAFADYSYMQQRSSLCETDLITDLRKTLNVLLLCSVFNWCCEGKILLVHPFICVVSPSLSCTLYSSPSHAHVHTHCVKWLFHLENCQNMPCAHISLFLSSVSSSRGCAGVCQKCAGIDKTGGAKQLCFIHFLSLFLPLFSSLLTPSPSLPCIGCEYPASEKSDQTDSQGSVSQRHRGCQSMLVPSCPTMHRARPTLLLPLLLVLGLFLHLADAQSKWSVGLHVGLKSCWVGGRGDKGETSFVAFSLNILGHINTSRNTHTT